MDYLTDYDHENATSPEWVSDYRNALDAGWSISWGGWNVDAIAAREEGEAVERGVTSTELRADAVARQRALTAELGLDFAPEDLRSPEPARAFLPETHSPIEQRLLEALVDFLGPSARVGRGYVHFGDWTIATQFRVGRYRVDISVRSIIGEIAVEADGHAYHERTKEQAAHDRRRDRHLQAAGWTVLRFTGSEIHQDAEGCAREVVEHMARMEQAARS